MNSRKFVIAIEQVELLFSGGYSWLFEEMKGHIIIGVKNKDEKSIYVNINNVLVTTKKYKYDFKFSEAIQPQTFWKGAKTIAINEDNKNIVNKIEVPPKDYVYLDFELRTKIKAVSGVNELLDYDEVITLHLDNAIKLGEEVLQVEPINFIPEQ